MIQRTRRVWQRLQRQKHEAFTSGQLLWPHTLALPLPSGHVATAGFAGEGTTPVGATGLDGGGSVVTVESRGGFNEPTPPFGSTSGAISGAVAVGSSRSKSASSASSCARSSSSWGSWLFCESALAMAWCSSISWRRGETNGTRRKAARALLKL